MRERANVKYAVGREIFPFKRLFFLPVLSRKNATPVIYEWAEPKWKRGLSTSTRDYMGQGVEKWILAPLRTFVYRKEHYSWHNSPDFRRGRDRFLRSAIKATRFYRNFYFSSLNNFFVRENLADQIDPNFISNCLVIPLKKLISVNWNAI